MNKKFTKIIFSVLIVLAAITFIPWAYDQIFPEKNELAKKISVDLSGFTKNKVSRISIKNDQSEKNISFENGIWKINGKEADPEKIDSLFEAFSSLKIKEMVSQNENNHSKFQVSADTGARLQISMEGKDFIFFIGKTDPVGTDFYIRKDGMKNVYLATGDLKEKILLDEEDWKKK